MIFGGGGAGYTGFTLGGYTDLIGGGLHINLILMGARYTCLILGV